MADPGTIYDNLKGAGEWLMRAGEAWEERVASLQTALDLEKTTSLQAKTKHDAWKAASKRKLERVVEKADLKIQLAQEASSVMINKYIKQLIEATNTERKLGAKAVALQKTFSHALNTKVAEIAELQITIEDQKKTSSDLEHKLTELTKDNSTRSESDADVEPLKIRDPTSRVPVRMNRPSIDKQERGATTVLKRPWKIRYSRDWNEESRQNGLNIIQNKRLDSAMPSDRFLSAIVEEQIKYILQVWDDETPPGSKPSEAFEFTEGLFNAVKSDSSGVAYSDFSRYIIRDALNEMRSLLQVANVTQYGHESKQTNKRKAFLLSMSREGLLVNYGASDDENEEDATD